MIQQTVDLTLAIKVEVVVCGMTLPVSHMVLGLFFFPSFFTLSLLESNSLFVYSKLMNKVDSEIL